MGTSILKMPHIHSGQEPDEILTLEEAVAFLKIKKRTLYDRVQRKTIPHLRAGKLIRFSKRALLNWMKEQADN
jgi:excisionase family DNA binding protein